MSDKPKLIFFPIAALHVAITEAVNARLIKYIYKWRTNWMTEECKRIWLRLSYQTNKNDRKNIIKVMKGFYGKHSVAYNAIIEFERLCIERYKLERNDQYYKSMYWNKETNTNEIE